MIVSTDVNEDIYKKSIEKTLDGNNDLIMVETVGTLTRKKVEATFF